MQRLFNDGQSIDVSPVQIPSGWERLCEKWRNTEGFDTEWVSAKWVGASLSALLLIAVIFLSLTSSFVPIYFVPIYFVPIYFVPIYITLIPNEDRSLQVAAKFDDEKNALRMEAQTGSPEAGRDIELWIIVDKQAPISLGLRNTSDTYDIIISSQLAKIVAGAILALSDEPIGGSPTRQPTDVVLAFATVTLI
ncbi:MAG: anti-sigma-K factor RskA [Candidatus Endobugula sp.]|jgi:anti-sigma-K factor RskA